MRPCWADKLPLWAFVAISLVLFVLGNPTTTPPFRNDGGRHSYGSRALSD